MLILFLIPGTPKDLLVYVAILILVVIVVLIINKFDKDKITKNAINSIK